MASEAYLRPPHPRRPTAQRSVSLRHSRPSPDSKDTRSSQTEASSGSPSSNKPNVSKADSGESSNADKWFEGANNNADGKNNTLGDNDPPFFLQNSSSEETPNYLGPSAMLEQSMPMHALLHKNDTEDSGSSDFRAVIDDLTIQNKKLKKRLKKYEKLHDAHLKDEKLFEVRVHGLSSNKRRELEEILRTFAVGAAGQPSGSASQTSNLYDRVVPTLKTHKTASSSSNFADSAYASNSASASASGLSNSNSGQQSKHSFRPSNKSRQSNIQTYLHDIPEGLLPQHPAVMTEYSKKKLVVRRLEQIFAGTGAVLGDHHHPIQQQEVSQMAARADRSALEANGQTAKIEGNREAPIMKDDEERSAQDSPEHSSGPEVTQGIEPSLKVVEQDFAGVSPQQRPTRPLDLDPHRAQNPRDNFQYIRHLGFSPPEPSTMEAQEGGHGWIYLNFLFNMAQLHTLNVTPEFAKKALIDFSTKFEISEDGRKVRWKGGRNITRSASEADSSPSTYGNSPYDKSPLKRSKSSHHKHGGKDSKRRMLEKQDSRFAYTPLFYHRSSEDDSDMSSSEDETESPFVGPPGGDSSAMTSSGIRTVSFRQQKKKTDNGPIIFYNNARFCTDLSGESTTEVDMTNNMLMYHPMTDHALGIPKSPEPAPKDVLEHRGPLNNAKDLPEAMSLNDNPIPEALEVSFPSVSPMSQAGPTRSPIALEASGIGGICPSDNFLINVRTEHKRVYGAPIQPAPKKAYPAHIASLFKESGRQQQQTPFTDYVVKTFHQELPPSELPPASCFMDVDEFDDDESEFGDYQSIVPEMDRMHDVPSTAPQTIDMPYLSSDESGEEEDEEDDDAASDGSLDLLATARKLDPQSVQAREREYDAHMAERLAEEIPAGSSAATAGGGSGFASPIAGISRKEYEAAKAEYMKRHASTIASAASIPRTETNESMIVNGQSP
ncbi:hypothetical protein D6D02_10006 [Aureobasidium pullulans]|nr:hypothetical protein D6D02_10006 [Aureobasidium pullulans]